MRPHGLAAAAAVMLFATACAPAEARESRLALEQGRRYTNWLYQGNYHRLWQGMAPEMRDLFDGPQELGAFGMMLTGLGSERRVLEEAVEDVELERVYSRTAAFSKAAGPVLIQWVLTDDGLVSGLAIGPAEESQLTLGERE